jgi:hypothetical protein
MVVGLSVSNVRGPTGVVMGLKEKCGGGGAAAAAGCGGCSGCHERGRVACAVRRWASCTAVRYTAVHTSHFAVQHSCVPHVPDKRM